MKKAVRLQISGTVQGVFFRAYIKENADKLGVKGFVRNLDDGRIEAFLEGNSSDVDKMLEICKKGHQYSDIKKCEIKEEKFQSMSEFKILHI